MIARDIMRRTVVTVSEDMTLKELARLLSEKRISGAPVVDAKGKAIGIVSQTDLVRRGRDADATAAPFYIHERWLGLRGYRVEAPDYTRVRDIMTPRVLSADEQTPVEALARQMLRRRVHRLLITRQGKVSGIVTSMDLLRVLLQAKAGGKAPRRRA